MPDAPGRGPDWAYLDDVVSAAVLLSVAISAVIGVAAGGYLVFTGSYQFSGTINVGAIIRQYLGPAFLVLFVVALLDVYGKRRIRGAFGLMDQVFNPQRQPGRPRQRRKENDDAEE